MNQDQSYFIENVKNDRLQETRNFKQLYKQMQLPTSKKDKAKFIKFLDTIENMHLRNVKQVWTLWLMSGLMLALVLFDRRLTLLNVGYSGVLILAFYGYFNSKKQLENIKVLRARLLQPT